MNPSKSKEESGKSCTLCTKLGLRPLTRDNILFFYAPLHSMVSYAALSINVMNPALIVRVLPKKDVTNFLLIHTMFGTTLYLFNRPHLKNAPMKKRIAYSLVGSSLFSMGSVLVWAVLRSAIVKKEVLQTVIGVTTAYAIARLSYDYIQHLDEQAPKQITSA